MARRRIEIDASKSEKTVSEDAFLRHAYFHTYKLMGGDTVSLDNKILELGSAGGIAKLFSSRVLTSDIRTSPLTDMTFSGTNIPFPKDSFDQVWIKDAIHHIEELEDLLAEIARVLKPNGTLSICEPYWGLTSQIIYRSVHPEGFSKHKALNQIFMGEGNQATYWALKTNANFAQRAGLDAFNLETSTVVNGIAWLISGGATFSTGFNPTILLKIAKLENRSPLWMKIFGLNIIDVYTMKS
jgi:SAM-dependent methyltransferase